MLIGGASVNGVVINGSVAPILSPDVEFILPGIDAPEVLQNMARVRLGLDTTPVGFTDEAFSGVGLFLWNSGQRCQFEDIIVANPVMAFDSIRDDGDNNRQLYLRLRCITGVDITHTCILGDLP